MIHRASLRVRYAETDQMGFAFHGHYVTWIEMARTELLRKVGCPYRELEKDGFLAPVLDVQIKYRSPVFYDDRVVIETWVSQLKRLKIQFQYRIFREGSDEVAAEAMSVLGCIGRDRKPRPWPDYAFQLLQKAVVPKP